MGSYRAWGGFLNPPVDGSAEGLNPPAPGHPDQPGLLPKEVEAVTYRPAGGAMSELWEPSGTRTRSHSWCYRRSWGKRLGPESRLTGSSLERISGGGRSGE